MLERMSDYFSWRIPWFARLSESTPVVLVEDGRPLQKVMSKEHVSTSDILSAARETQGLERLDQIKWAVLETSGGISVVPKMNAAPKQ